MAQRLKDVVKVPIPTTQVGRYPRPGWYNHNIGDRGWVEMCNDPSFLEAFTDATRTTMIDQEMAGTDILTDGCIRYDMPLGTLASWDTNNIAYMGGMKRMEGIPDGRDVMATFLGDDYYKVFYEMSRSPRRQAGHWWWRAEDEPSVGKLGLWVETARVALPYQSSERPLKFSGPSAAIAAQHCVNKTGKSDRDVYFALTKVQNKVLRDIANAGCKIIQVDYPFGSAHWVAQLRKIKKDTWKDLIDGFNEEISGVNANIWVHFCFGAPILYSHETPPLRWHMTDVYPEIAECNADCFQSEAANTDGKYLDDELKAWKEYCSEKDYAVGAVTPYDLTETAEDVARIVEKALRYVPPEKLALSTDEGIAGHGVVNRWGASIKMKLLSQAASSARKKLG